MKTKKIILLAVCLVLIAVPLQAAEKLTFSTIEGANNALISGKAVAETYRRIGIETVVGSFPGLRSLVYSNTGETDGELYRIAGVTEKCPNLLMVPVPVNVQEGMVFTKQTEFAIKGWDRL